MSISGSNKRSHLAESGIFSTIIAVSSAILLLMFPILASINASGDGMYIPESGVDIYEPGQNAVIAWNGHRERMYLSVNIFGEEETDGFHVVPFPSEPEISEGSSAIFDELNEIVQRDDYIYKQRGYHIAPTFGSRDSTEEKVIVTQQKKIGVHDITIIRIDDAEDFHNELMKIVDEIGIDIETWPEGLNEIIQDYCERGIKFFSIDHYPISDIEATIKPVVYEFDTDEVFFPLQISSVMEAGTKISLGIIHPKDVELDSACFRESMIDEYIFISLDREDINDLDPVLRSFVGTSAMLSFYQFKTNLKNLTGDVIMPKARSVAGFDDCDDFTFSSNMQSGFNIRDSTYTMVSGSTRDKQIMCIDGSRKEVKWIIDRAEDYYCEERKMLPVRDNGDEYHPVLLDFAKHDRNDHFIAYIVVYELDPETGEITWERKIDDYPSGAKIFRTIMDHSGKEHILIAGSGFIILDLLTGETEKVYVGLEGLDHSQSSFIIDTGEGEVFAFHEAYTERSHLIDPFAPGKPDRFNRWGDPNSTFGEIEDISIATIGDEIFNAFYHNGTVIGWTYGNTSLRYHLDQWDLMTGEFLGTMNHSFYPRLKEPELIIDIDEDGDSELIYARFSNGMNNGSLQISAFDPDIGYFQWISSISGWEYEFGNIEATVIDYGCDGEMNLLVSSGRSRDRPEIRLYSRSMAVLSLSKGTVIINATTRIDPHYGLDPYEKVDSFLIEDDGLFTVIDADIGELGPFKLEMMEETGEMDDPDFPVIEVYFLDLDGDGNKEISLFSDHPDMDRIIHMDPYDDDPRFLEEWLMGRTDPFTIMDSSKGSSILLFHKHMVYWMSGEISDEKEPIDPIRMAQVDVYILSNPGDEGSSLMGLFPEGSRPIIATILVGAVNVVLLIIAFSIIKLKRRKKGVKQKK